MTGNIQIEVLNESTVLVEAHLKDVTGIDPHNLVMFLARALDMSSDDILLAGLMYPDFLAKTKSAKSDLSNNRSTPDL
nr:MAG TPA: hypothetical protein [Caudoviricetes sp.]